MTLDRHRDSVVGFYDTHPINEEEILAKLQARGVDVDRMTQDDLGDLDQDHYGGLAALEALAIAAGIVPAGTADGEGAGGSANRPIRRVLDVCSGMGGPARWLAHRYGCRVTGIDLTASRVAGATRLTERLGLADRVDFVHGDATDMPFDDESFDAVVGQEAWVHVPDRTALVSECARVVRGGGVIGFTDIVSRSAMNRDEAARLLDEMKMSRPATAAEYVALLEAAGCRIEACVDLSDDWIAILRERHRMFQSLRDTTVARHGEARYHEYDRAYGFFVDLFAQGRLGGARLVAHRG